MSDQHPPTDPALWEGVWSWVAMLGAAGAGLLAAMRGWARRDKPDFESMARAWFAAKAEEDEKHRDAIVEAIQKLCEVTRVQHEETRRELREVNDETRDRIGRLLEAFSNGLVAANTKLDLLLRNSK